MVKFDVSLVPSSVALMSAKLRLYVISATSYNLSDRPVLAFPVTKAWDESLVSWRGRTAVKWATFGGEFDPTPVDSGLQFSELSGGTWIEYDLPLGLVQGWLADPATNHGLIVKQVPDGDPGMGTDRKQNEARFESSESLDAALRPQFELVIADPILVPGQASGAVPADTSTEASRLSVVTWESGSDAAMHTVFFGANVSLGSGDEESTQHTNSFDPGPLEPSTTYYWRIDESNLAGTTTGIVWSFTTTDDSDGDGLPDVGDLDDDGDGLSDDIEIVIGSDPLMFDTDGDGYSDGVEYDSGTDPNDALDTPRTDEDGGGDCSAAPGRAASGSGLVAMMLVSAFALLFRRAVTE